MFQLVIKCKNKILKIGSKIIQNLEPIFFLKKNTLIYMGLNKISIFVMGFCLIGL